MGTALKQVFHARRAAQEELRGLYDLVDNRPLTADELRTESRIGAEISDLQERETNLHDLDQQERAADEARAGSRVARATDAARRSRRNRIDDPAEEGIRQLLAGEARSIWLPATDEQRDNVVLQAGSVSDGAELVPTTPANEVLEILRNSDPILPWVRQIITQSGEDLVFAKTSSLSIASIVSEGAVIGADAPQFETKTLGSYKYAFLVQATRELLEDSGPSGFVELVARQGLEALGAGFGAHVIAGTGTSQPNGIVNGTVGLTLASSSTITIDELQDAVHAVEPRYRPGSVWVFNDATALVIKKLKDADGRFLWQPALDATQPDQLLGYPVVVAPTMPTFAVNAKVGVFGNLGRGYIARLVRGVEVVQSADFAFDADLTTYRFVARSDGEIVDPAAFTVIQAAAV